MHPSIAMGVGCHSNGDVNEGLGVSGVKCIVKSRMWGHVKGQQASGGPIPIGK